MDKLHLQRPRCTRSQRTCDRSRTHAPGKRGCVSRHVQMPHSPKVSCTERRAHAQRGIQHHCHALTFHPLSVVHSCSGGGVALQKCPVAQSECRRQAAPACWVPGHCSNSKPCAVPPSFPPAPPAGFASRKTAATTTKWVRIIDYGTPCHSLAQCICCWQDCGQTSSPAFSSICSELQPSSILPRRPESSRHPRPLKNNLKEKTKIEKRRGGVPSICCGGLKAPLSQPWSTTWGCSTRCWARVLGGRRRPPLRSREGWDSRDAVSGVLKHIASQTKMR